MTKPLIVLLLLVMLCGVHVTSYRVGLSEGTRAAEVACKDAQIAQLNRAIAALQALNNDEQARLVTLQTLVNRRAQADHATTEELRHALNSWQQNFTDTKPVVCRFPDHIMQQLRDATERANAQATRGLGAVSINTLAGGQ